MRWPWMPGNRKSQKAQAAARNAMKAVWAKAAKVAMVAPSLRAMMMWAAAITATKAMETRLPISADRPQ